MCVAPSLLLTLIVLPVPSSAVAALAVIENGTAIVAARAIAAAIAANLLVFFIINSPL